MKKVAKQSCDVTAEIALLLQSSPECSCYIASCHSNSFILGSTGSCQSLQRHQHAYCVELGLNPPMASWMYIRDFVASCCKLARRCLDI